MQGSQVMNIQNGHPNFGPNIAKAMTFKQLNNVINFAKFHIFLDNLIF